MLVGYNGTMPRDGRTGLVIPVPAADEALAWVSGWYPEAVRDGVPAHLSLLYPFLAAGDLDAGVLTALREVFDHQPPMRVVLSRCRRRGGFVYLVPEPVAPLRDLIGALRSDWPAPVAHRGLGEEVEPHVTVAMGVAERTAAVIQREASESLPLTVELSEAWLVVLRGRWRLHGRFAFGG